MPPLREQHFGQRIITLMKFKHSSNAERGRYLSAHTGFANTHKNLWNFCSFRSPGELRIPSKCPQSQMKHPCSFFNAEKWLWQWSGQTENPPQFRIRDNFCAALANMVRKRRGIHFTLLALICRIAGLHLGKPFPHHAFPIFILSSQVFLSFKHRDKSWCDQIHPS